MLAGGLPGLVRGGGEAEAHAHSERGRGAGRAARRRTGSPKMARTPQPAWVHLGRSCTCELRRRRRLRWCLPAHAKPQRAAGSGFAGPLRIGFLPGGLGAEGR